MLTRLARLFPPETAHRLAVRAVGSGLLPAGPPVSGPRLAVPAFGQVLPNPIGLAAGFDKNAEAYAGLLRQGFGFVEVGTVTPRPQAGNPKPRLFRLSEDEAVVNRLGFNGEGLERVRARLIGREPATGCVGVNLGMNKDTDEPLGDYVRGLEAFHGLADYLVVNVSSPNTPGLRDLQARGRLEALLSGLVAARARVTEGAPVKSLLVKIAPDLSEADRIDIAEAALAVGIDGLIVGNTTVARPPGLRSRHKAETGGLSGRPLFEPSTRLLAAMRKATEGRLLLIGTGGVATGADAYAKIRAGASLVQLYTSMIYKGFGVAGRIASELDGLLAKDGFASVSEAVGIDA